MNVREGIRRLGTLLGACGGILGGCLSYRDLKTTWDTDRAHGRFESLTALPTMRRAAKAARPHSTMSFPNM